MLVNILLSASHGKMGPRPEGGGVRENTEKFEGEMALFCNLPFFLLPRTGEMVIVSALTRRFCGGFRPVRSICQEWQP